MTSRLAWLAPLVAACGSAHHTTDANIVVPGDTLGPPTADAAPGSVTIAVTVGGRPAANVPVYFQQGDGTVVLAATTDAHGTVGAMVGAGGFVTAIEPADGSGVVKLDTFSGVQPNDLLHLDLAPPPATTGADTMLTLPVFATAAAYMVYAPCGSVQLGPSGSGEVSFPGCANTADLLAVALDVNGNPLKAFLAQNVAIGPAPSDAMGLALDLSASAWLDLAPTSFAYQHVPATTTWVKTTQELVSPRGRLFDQTTGAAPAAANASDSLMQPAPTGLLAVTVTDITPDATTNANQHGEQLVYDWDSWNGTYSLDLNGVLLAPYLSDPAYTDHKVTWTEGQGTTADYARAQLTVTRDAVPTATTWQWNIAAPRLAGTSIAFPTLPVEGFDYNPATADTVAIANLTNVRVQGGYDAVRPHAFAPVAGLVGDSATGRLVIQLPFSPQL